MRVELEVDLRPARPVAKTEPVDDPKKKAEKQRRDREERTLRRIALAQAIEAGVAAGTFTDLADAARRCGVSKSMVSKVVSWREASWCLA